MRARTLNTDDRDDREYPATQTVTGRAARALGESLDPAADERPSAAYRLPVTAGMTGSDIDTASAWRVAVRFSLRPILWREAGSGRRLRQQTCYLID